MSNIMDDPTPLIAARLKAEREARGWSLADFASRSGVSRAMISKVERGEASPTAALLGRLSGALELTLSTLLSPAEVPGARLRRAAEQPLWVDPATGYARRSVNPPTALPLDVVEVELPAGAQVPIPASAYAFLRHLIWVRAGVLTFVEGEKTHTLERGDCLELGPAQPCRYENRTQEACRYVVLVMRNER